MTDVTRILSRIESGDQKAAEELLPLVYDELRKLASATAAADGGFGRFSIPLLPVHQQKFLKEANTNPEEQSTSVTGWDRLADHRNAVDWLMEDRQESPVSAAEMERLMALDQVIDELLGGLGDDVLSSG